MPYNTETQAKEPMVFNYTVDWKEGKVNQMWLEPFDGKYVAVAYDPRNRESMVMSHPRTYEDTLQWIRKYCCSFCFLPEYC